MSPRRVVAVALVAVGAVALVIGVVELASDDSSSSGHAGALGDAVRTAPPAVAPFLGLTELGLAVDDRCLHVVVADSLAERIEGLRGRRDIGDYDGMLFVFDGPTRVPFTMSTVPVILDVGFYDARGRLVSRRRMKPCAEAEDRCPSYEADADFTYALEALRGRLPGGAISSCPS